MDKMKNLTNLMRLSVTVLFAFLSMGFSYAQMKVNGQVVDQSGEPVIGANVLEKGTTNGTITDFDGNFELNVKKGATLVISFVGYITQEVKATENMKVTLAEDSELLDDVVVVGYGVQKKSSLTGAISSVKDNDISNRTINSAQEALQGKTSGVQVVNTSGKPGSTPNIRVRGYSSNADMSPLFVVDGIIVSDISAIDPGDIQNMEVLKDASSAAIYGAQAGNGVVLITTKKGAKGNEGWGQVTYDYQFSSQSLGNTPRMLNAREYAEFMAEAKIFQEETINKYWDGKTDTDWFDAVFTNSAQHKHKLSLSSANDKGSVYIGLSSTSNNGILKGDQDLYKRLTGVVNVEYKFKPWLKASANNNIGYTTQNSANISLANVFMADPLTKASYAANELPENMKALMAAGKTILQDEDGNYYGVSNFFNYGNPLIDKDASINKFQNFDISGNVSLDITPIKDLTITSKFGYRLNAGHNTAYSQDSYSCSMIENPFVSFRQQNNDSRYYQWDNYLNYIKSFGDHDLTAMVGHSFTHSYNTFTNGAISPNGEHAVIVDNPDLFGWLDFASGSASHKGTGVATENSSESYFGRLSYSYKGKYMAQASFRADAFDLSKLPLSNRWGYFPAFSAAWVPSMEAFWSKMPDWFNYMKVRASYGKNGSIGALSGYLYSTNMAAGNFYSFGNDRNYGYVTSYTPTSMGNDKLTWETSTQIDLGLDFRFLDNRLTLGMDWYKKTTEDLLITGLKSSLIAGGTFSPQNAGDVENTGFEFEAAWRDKIGDFSYGIRGNISTLKNKVTYLSPGIDYIQGYRNNPGDIYTIFEEGSEVWHFFGYKYLGLDKSNGEPIFEDVNQDGEINSDDRTNLGSAIPTLNYGITIDMNYKGFDFMVFGSGSAGNKIYQGTVWSDRISANRVKSVWYDDRWTPANANGSKPAASADLSKYLVSSAMVMDGSYFRIKQIQLGYTLPKSLVKKIGLTNLRAYVSMEDWFTFTNYSGFDPESCSVATGSGQGVDFGAYPTSRKLVLGANITF